MNLKYIVKVVGLSLFLFVLGLFKTDLALATECTTMPYSGNETLTGETCSYSDTIVGVDTGAGEVNTAVMTVGAGTTLTISDGQTFVTGSFSIADGGSMVIVDGSTIKIGAALYVTDSDGDGFAANTTLYLDSAAGRVRKSTLISSDIDCDDNSNSGTNTCCVSHEHCSTCCDSCCDGVILDTGADNCIGCAVGPIGSCNGPYSVPYDGCSCYYINQAYDCNCVSCNCYTHCH